MSQLILPASELIQPPSARLNRASPQATGLVAAWPFIEGFNNVAGLPNAQTVYNGPTIQPTAGRRAALFNGTNQYLNAAIAPVYPATVSGNWSVAFWARPLTSLSVRQSFFGTRNPSEYGTDFKINGNGNGNVAIDLGNGTTFLTNTSWLTSAQIGVWGHYCLVATPTGVQLYFNGEPLGLKTYSGTPLLWDANHELYIGQMGQSAEWFGGNISDFRVYNRAVSAGEARAIYANPWQIFRKSKRLVFVGGSSIARSIAEALSASDSSSITIIRFATQTEAATATDSQSQTNSVSGSTTETATATDSTSQGQVLAASTTETATATDSTSALRQILAAVDEAASAAQTAAATALTTAASVETATATDATTSAQAGVSSVDETTTATDTPQSTGEVTKSATEAVSATDSPASGNQLQAALTEAATATDAPSAYRVLSAAAQEIASATDALTALLQQVVAVDEAARAQDLIAQINSLSSAITEAATATDAPITIQTLALIVSWQFYARQAARFFYAAAPFRAFYTKAPFRSFYALCQSDMAVPIPYAIDPSETKVITLDATADLSGVTLTGTPTIAVAVTKGSDPNASAHFTSPTINTTPISVTTSSGASVTIATGLAVQFIASGCVDGCSYEIRITCQTSQANNVEVLKASLTCTAS